MSPMFVNLEVTKLSAWLNADASCRVERRACEVGRGTAQEREGVGRWQCKRHAQGGPDFKAVGGQGTRGAHLEHGLHARDAGRHVEAQRLVERIRVLPSREGGIGRGACGRGDGGVGGRGGASSALGGPNRGGGRQGTRVAHRKHILRVRDAGHVEAQRLVERLRVLPS